jgi:hypothetical protein
MRGVVGRTSDDPIEQHLGALLGQPRVLSEELRLFAVQVCESPDVPFEGAHAPNQWIKKEILECIVQIWDALGETFITVAANQRIMSGHSCG